MESARHDDACHLRMVAICAANRQGLISAKNANTRHKLWAVASSWESVFGDGALLDLARTVLSTPGVFQLSLAHAWRLPVRLQLYMQHESSILQHAHCGILELPY